MRALTIAPLLVVIAGLPAAAQVTPAFNRADAQATVGWNNIRHDQPRGAYENNNNWMNDIGLMAGGFGWFWTEHLRTTFDAGINSTGEQYQYEATTENGQQVYRSSHLEMQQRQFALGQQYQFGHNAWFEPHAGGGALFGFQHSERHIDPSYYYDQATRTTRTIGGYSTDTRNDTIVRPFVDFGFKAYMSRHTYFVHDTRFVLGSHGLDQVGFNFGLGFDFQ